MKGSTQARQSQHMMGIPVEHRAMRSGIRTAKRTTATTTINTNIRQIALRPARRWYSWAVVNSSAAPAVSTAIEDILDSMLSGPQDQWRYSRCDIEALTQHIALLLDERSKITEYLMKLMYARLDLSNFGFPFLDEGLLVGQLLRGKLGL